jgi:hypothetical protein
VSARSVLVVGAGRRVLETALPALCAMEPAMRVERVLARRARTIRAAERDWEVEPLEALEALPPGALVYMAVGKDAVPGVLRRLAGLGADGADLLIDTPVVRFKHLRHARVVSAFREAWVSEDCATLPWIPLLREAVDAGAIGRPVRLVFDRSAYAYHGVATAKAVLGSNVVTSGRRRRTGEGAVRELRLAGGLACEIREPRDYTVGSWRLEGTEGAVTDRSTGGGELVLEPVVRGDACAGFRVGERTLELDDAEAALTRPWPADATVSSAMDALKRVGFLRLLRSIDAGLGAYPAVEGLDDMVVDYHLEKFGRYLANPFTSYRSPLARALLGLVTR